MSSTRVAIAGSSGSIGTQTLDVIRACPDQFEVVALSVGSAADAVIAQAGEFHPQVVAVADADARRRVAGALPGVEVVASIVDAVATADVTINAVVGFAGLPVTVATLAAGRRLGLANKESLIAAGPVVQPLRSTPGAELVPVDSEHCALHQCLRSSLDTGREVARLVLTASGGPFRGRTAADLADVTVDQALAHPTWSMGPVVTINSATLVNKGLEVIEAHLLFGVPFDRIEVVVHPTSVVHSMVEFVDGSTILQASPPTMLIPIALGLAWPDRVPETAPAVDWSRPETWQFFPLDDEAFPAVSLARRAGERGATAPAVYNAANEVCVAEFLAGRMRFVDIVPTIAGVLAAHDVPLTPQGLTVDDVLAADTWARAEAARLISERPST